MTRPLSRFLPWSLGVLVALGLLAWGGFALFGRKENQNRRPPYWRRNDWVSRLLLDSPGGPKGVEAMRVPAGFQVERACLAGLVKYPVFATLDDRGRLFVCESAGKNISDEEMGGSPEFRIRLLEDTDGDGVYDQSRIFADRLTMAMGALWYRGSLYVTAPPDILRLEDSNGDGVADRREVILTGWPLRSNGTTFHGPYLGPDGWMYFTYNLGPYKIRTKEGTLLEGPGGRVWRCRPDGTGLESFVGGGFDNGIEIVFTPAGETIGTMTYYSEPKLGERDALLHFVEGGVYPKWRPIVEKYKRTGEMMPALTKFARIAPSGLARHSGLGFGPAWEGNLFSAQFNPHRVQRHVLERDGGTFRSQDQDFLTSEDPDFHPTDVLEDADGSLLVVDTGAWYLHSCPVSRVAKPQFQGALYRVRKSGAAPVQDPWGKALDWNTVAPAEWTRLLEDARPAVREQALDRMVRAGEASVESLKAVRQRARAPETRAAAVFGLARNGGGKAAQAVRASLSDPGFLVRVAAARAVGLARDGEAVPRLMEIVRRDHPAARRQAATALGQIGDRSAVPALLAAAADPEDRFVEHSIIYALIVLGDSAPAIQALGHANPKVRKAALIVLDQMDGAPFERARLAPMLGDADAGLRRAALWVASRHPDWSAETLPFLRARLRSPRLSAEESSALRQTLSAFCSQAGAQALIAEQVTGPAAQRELLLEVMEQCPAQPFPGVWAEAIRKLIRAGDAETRARPLVLIRSRQISTLDDELERIAGNAAEPDSLRLLALGSLVPRRGALAEPGFQFLLGLLQAGAQADLRLHASAVLGRAKLSESQLLVLARDSVPRADALVLPNLLDAFRRVGSEQAAAELVAGLARTPRAVDGLLGDRIPELVKTLPRAAQAAAAPLLERVRQQKEARAQRLKALEPLLAGGDAGRGRLLFFGKKAGCSGCHTILVEGAAVGPDLTGIGAVRSGLDLIEAIVFPSASFVPGHEVYRVETAAEVHTGVQGESTPEAVVILSGPNDRVRIPRKQIVSMRPALVSLMPDGFAEELTRQELNDLLAFLQAQKARAVVGAAEGR